MIEFSNVTKLYGSVIGVNDISLSLGSGAYGLLGPNGSGKTTLINLVVGQLNPTLGTVRVFGENPWKRDRILRRIGLCPAVDVLYANVTAYDWVCYLLQLHRFTSRDAASRAREMLERVGMEHAMHRPMGGYSLGMRQRTKIAQALAHDPDLLVLDEPFNGLDPVGRHEMSELLRNWSSTGRTLLMASHVLHEVEAVSPAFLLICGGRLLASGSPEEVHSMLADLPSQIRIRCDRPKELAQHILQKDSVHSVQFAEDGQVVVVTTDRPLGVYQDLPEWTERHGLTVQELHSSDESLQALFTSLMSIHRGQM